MLQEAAGEAKTLRVDTGQRSLHLQGGGPVTMSNRHSVLFCFLEGGGRLEGFAAVTALRLLCVYSSCTEQQAHVAADCSERSRSVSTDQRLRAGQGSTWGGLSATSTNPRTFSEQQTEQQKTKTGSRPARDKNAWTL